MELLDVLDENGNITGKQEDKDIIHETGIKHREVCCIIEHEKEENMIQKRAATKKQAPNKWGMTAGHVDAGETYEEAMVREIEEELGITVAMEDLKLLGIFKEWYESEKTTNNNFIKYYYYKTNKTIQDYTICLEELSEVKYISFQELEITVKKKDENCSYAQREEMNEVIKILKNINS